MRTNKLWLWILVLPAWLGTGSAGEPRPPLQPLRYDEDYRFLTDPSQRTDPWDALKYIPLAGTEAGYLSLGGEARVRFQAYENELFRTQSSADNSSFLQRYLLHADYHAGSWLRLFAQLQSSLEDGRKGGPRPTDRDDLDLHQLFADVALLPDDAAQLTLRTGRQELSYGAERLVGTRDGLNNRRAFDAVRLLYRQHDLSLDVFFSSPVEVDPGIFDNQPPDDLWLWGAYATVPIPALPGIKLDLYYLGLHNPDAVFNQGAGREERHTVGTRFSGKMGRWDFNHEALYQFGKFGPGDISAWSVATDHGYTFENTWSKPRLGLKAAIASGDRSQNSADLQTLNPLFPRGNYFSEAALLGPQNFMDLHPCLRLQPCAKWTLDFGADFYWRESLGDGIYTPGGTLIYAGDSGLSRFVGTDLSLVVSWQATRNFSISAAGTRFVAGRFIRQNGGQDVNYGAVWASYKF